METKTHSFNISDAENHGVNKAILLHNLRFWLDKELANTDRDEKDSGPKVREHDGTEYVWTYNSASAFSVLFPYMTAKSIGRWLRELEDDGVIISAVHNKQKYDKTKWYTMPEYSVAQKRKSVAQNETTDWDISGNLLSETGQPIPDINTDVITDTGESSDSQLENSKKVRQEIWEALISVLNYSVEDMTKNIRGQMNNAVKQLFEVGATPAEILKRANAYKRIYPQSTMTAMALVNRWADCTSVQGTNPKPIMAGVQYDKAETEYTFNDKGDVIL